jgi:hypothetical protein
LRANAVLVDFVTAIHFRQQREIVDAYSASAVLLIVLASACFTSVDVTVKHLSQRYPVPLLVWARWGVQTLLMLAILAPRLRWNLVRTRRLPLHILRGLVLVGSGACFFSALKYLPLAEATGLVYMSPILTRHGRWLLRVRGCAGLSSRISRHAVDRPPGTEVLHPAAFFGTCRRRLVQCVSDPHAYDVRRGLMVLLFFRASSGTTRRRRSCCFSITAVSDSRHRQRIGTGFRRPTFIRVSGGRRRRRCLRTAVVWPTLAGRWYSAVPDA